MRKVRSFDQDPPVHPATAHPVYLIALQQLRQGSCFTLHPQLYGGYTYPATVSVMHGLGQARRTKKANPVRARP